MSGVEDALERLERRMDQLERLVQHQTLVESADYAKAVTYSPSIFRLRHDDGRLRAMRMFKCWADLPVREGVIARHRQMTLHQAVAELTEEFGADRAPSRSALQRIWQRLDEIRGI